METIFRWLARMLAGILERYADPDLEARLKSFNDRVTQAEQKALDAAELARQSEVAYAASVENRKRWDALLAESKLQEQASEERLRASQERVRVIIDETKKLNDAVRSRSDDDAFGGGVPKPKNN
jgi:hypothetical protein